MERLKTSLRFSTPLLPPISRVSAGFSGSLRGSVACSAHLCGSAARCCEVLCLCCRFLWDLD